MRHATPSWAAAIAVCLAAIPATASVSIYMTPEHLARRSPLVVEAVVESSASGFDAESRRLSTYVTLRVTAVHRGPRHLERVVLREPGGQVGTLVHEVDAVPAYQPGERVFAFLEPAGDGALRTTGMFYGKYRLADGDEAGAELAYRDLQGQGRIFGGPGPMIERVSLDDLIAVTATVRGRDRRWVPVPRELAEPVGASGGEPEPTSGNETASPPMSLEPELAGDRGGLTTRFVPHSTSHPARWQQSDAGVPVIVDVQRDNDPLGDGDAAVAEIARALEAWTAVPEARVALQLGEDDYDYNGNHGASPAAVYSGRNVVLFGDPFDDISDPVGCAGMLAIGGYWRSTTMGNTVNNVAFHPALQLYVIFNNGFECFLGDPANLAEVATHELGHGLGFGHSQAPDSIMRSLVYGAGRGARLGDDDHDAAHCHYPHTLEITRPEGGERWVAGTLQSIEWSVTSEQGPDPGVVALEYSTDGGASWETIASGLTNDGHHGWVVPDLPATEARVRVVRHHLTEFTPQSYPDACSVDESAPLEIVQPPPTAGSIGDDALRIGREGVAGLKLAWAPSCSSQANDYAIYEGSLAELRNGYWGHQPVECSAGPDLSEVIEPSTGDRYYLVAPLAGSVEGLYGRTGSGRYRPASSSACAPRQTTSFRCE